MSVVSKLYLTIGVFVMIATGGLAIAVTSILSADYHLERAHLAHSVYEHHLSLEHQITQFNSFYSKQISRVQPGDDSRDVAPIVAIRKTLDDIRVLIGREVELVGSGEIEELERLSKIERAIEVARSEYISLLSGLTPDKPTSHWQELGQRIGEKLAQDLSPYISASLKDEAQEVEESTQSARANVAKYWYVAGGFALVAIVAMLVCVSVLSRDLQNPIQALITAVQEFAGGDLSYRIENTRRGELGDVARAFNRMAGQIQYRQTVLSDANTKLANTLTERNSELERAVARLEQAEALRRRLITDFSHELRTPLTIIRGEADVALRGQDKTVPVYKEVLEKTRDAAQHTSLLVDDLLFVARHEDGDDRMKTETLDLVALIEQTIAGSSGIDPGKQVNCRITTEHASAFIKGDSRRLRQVIMILLENAVRYGGRDIEVSIDRDQRGYIISVTDDGPGMSLDDLEHAFERFYRGSNASKAYDQGIGLGLPVAKAIVEAHGGEINLDSAPGQGTTASFRVPLSSN